jgi:uncharacterized membrane protein
MAVKLSRVINVASTTWTLGAEIIGALAQIALISIGIELLTELDEDPQFDLLILWCVLGTLYLVGTVAWLNLDLRLRSEDHVVTRWASGARLMSILSITFTFLSSIVGLWAAVWLLLMRNDPDYPAIIELIPVWAMLLSWCLFNWGFARIYHSRCLRAGDTPPIRFPGTENPRLTDFVYFSFTNGTTFGVSDTTVTDSKMRWTVVWHTTISFFFNALIIVLTMNTISGGFVGL